MTKLLSSVDDILAIQDREYEDIEVKQWGVTVRIATMSGADRDKWELSMMQSDSSSERGFKLNFDAYSRAGLIALCLVDEKFQRVFDTPDKVEALSQKSAAVLDVLYEAAQRINGITDADIDDLEKNSAAAQNGDSGSG